MAEARQGPSLQGEQRYSRRQERPSPTHFIALQVDDPDLKKNLVEVQREMGQRVSWLQQLLVRPVTFHWSLAMLKLEGKDDEEKAGAALDAAGAELQRHLTSAPDVTVQGLGNFGPAVVFAKVTTGERQIQAMAGTVQEFLKSRGVNITDRWPFTAHVTLAKTSRLDKEERQGARIPRYAWADHQDKTFGRQTLKSLQLCAMRLAGSNKYYEVIHETRVW